MNWQPIDSAPKDGTPILTEDGIVKYKARGNGAWCFCDSGGDPFVCADEGPFWAAPKYWMPLPKCP